MRKKTQITIILICLSLLYSADSAFSQRRREFERIRAVAVPAGEDPLSGGGGIIDYYISIGDTIEVFVWQNPDLTREVIIRPDGKISYPLVGTIKAAGLTIEQLQSSIRDKLSRYIRSPEVTVSVREVAGNKIIILGEVNFPGIYTYKGTINLLEALALAGDFTRDGKRESVIVVSDNLTEEPKARRVNIFRAMRKGTSKRDILLKPNDVVYVPRNFIADYNKFVNDIQPTIDTAISALDLRTSIRTWYKHHGE